MDIVTIKDNGFILNTRDLSYAFIVDKYNIWSMYISAQRSAPMILTLCA